MYLNVSFIIMEMSYIYSNYLLQKEKVPNRSPENKVLEKYKTRMTNMTKKYIEDNK